MESRLSEGIELEREIRHDCRQFTANVDDVHSYELRSGTSHTQHLIADAHAR